VQVVELLEKLAKNYSKLSLLQKSVTFAASSIHIILDNAAYQRCTFVTEHHCCPVKHHQSAKSS
jgi:hypothetical protein